jgi:hypothetical protein
LLLDWTAVPSRVHPPTHVSVFCDFLQEIDLSHFLSQGDKGI